MHIQFKSLFAVTVVGLIALPAVTRAHDDDPKVLSGVPAYPGPGLQTRVPAPGESAASNQLASFQSSNFTLLSWLPLNDFGAQASGNDCWGYVSPSGREYALMGLSDGTGFVDITLPNVPVIVAVMPGPSSLWHDIKVWQHYAYVVSEAGGGIQVFDMSLIDSGIVTQVGSVTTGGLANTHNLAIDEVSGFLYRCGGGGNGLRIYDLNASATNPPFVGAWSTKYVHDAEIVTYTSGPAAGKQIAYCAGGYNGGGTSTGLTVVDVTNKANPIILRERSWPNAGYSHQLWLSEDQRYLYLNDEFDENGTFPTTTYVFDVQNPSTASLVSSFTNGNTAVGHNLYVKDNKIYEANYRSGLRVFDATNATSPVEIGYFDTWPGDDDAAYNGLWSCYPFFPSGTVIGSDRERGLFVWWEGPTPVTIDVPNQPDPFDPAGEDVLVTISELQSGNLVAGSEKLHYDVGAGFVTVDLVALGGGQYHAQLPATPCGVEIQYYVSARSSNGITWTQPEAAPSATYQATSALAETQLVNHGFELSAGWTTNPNNDTATGGHWIRTEPVGTGAQPEDDHSPNGVNCWVTGNAGRTFPAGQNDVDGGSTTLITAKYDVRSLSNPHIRYWRWFSNSTGPFPGEDTFVVEISNNNGQTWTSLEVVGPTGAEAQGGWRLKQFRIADYVNPNARIKLRFVASDLLNESIVEAAIDDFTIFDVQCPSIPQTYCTAKLNSQGCTPAIGYAGTPSATAPTHFEITATNVINNKNGLVFYGFAQASTPFQGGFKCVAAPTKRTPLQDSAGNLPPNDCSGSYSYDFNARIQTGNDVNLVVGAQVFAQYWSRDPASPSTTGLTDALAFTIEP